MTHISILFWVLLFHVSIFCAVNAQVQEPDNSSQNQQEEAGRVFGTSDLAGLKIFFTSPSPGSLNGVCEKEFPEEKLGEGDEVFEVTGKITFEQPVEGFRARDFLNLELTLEIRQLVNIDVEGYLKSLNDYRENHQKILSQAYKEYTETIKSDGKMKKAEVEMPSEVKEKLQNEIERKFFPGEDKLILSTTEKFRRRLKYVKSEEGLVTIPFAFEVIPPELPKWSIFKIVIRDSRGQILSSNTAMFYTYLPAD